MGHAKREQLPVSSSNGTYHDTIDFLDEEEDSFHDAILQKKGYIGIKKTENYKTVTEDVMNNKLTEKVNSAPKKIITNNKTTESFNFKNITKNIPYKKTNISSDN